jgi:Xaa-Pro dipeptidase
LVRLVKSPAECDYIRKAGAICDMIRDKSLERCRPGVSTKEIYGDMMQIVLAQGGDPSASRWPLGAGQMALLARYHTGEEIVREQDQVFFEPAASYRHYHACAMYNVITGKASALQRDMSQACAEALDSCQQALTPGRTVGEVFDIHKQVMDRAGFGEAAMSACGYTLGATYPPTWMDWPMFWTGNPQTIEPGMIFFLHMILFDRNTGTSMGLGETMIVRESGGESVNSVPRNIIEIN